jgi:hypothetical protein
MAKATIASAPSQARGRDHRHLQRRGLTVEHAVHISPDRTDRQSDRFRKALSALAGSKPATLSGKKSPC